MNAPTNRLRPAALQQDAIMTALNLSPRQAPWRQQRPAGEGFITGHRARRDPDRLGLTMQASLHSEPADRSPDTLKTCRILISACPKVISAWTLTGEADYLVRVWCADLAAVNRLIHHVTLPHPAIARVQSQIIMDQMKADTALPI